MENFCTVFATVISGVLVYLLGEILKEHWLEPYHQYKKLKGEIAFALVYYANYYSNPVLLSQASDKEIDKRKSISDELRSLSGRLHATAETRAFIAVGIPKREKLRKAARYLMGISNGLFTVNDAHFDDNVKRAYYIRKMLKIIDEGKEI